MLKKDYSKEDASLETLLELDGEVFPMDNGYWTKLEACRVTPTPHIPHGIKYSLTMRTRLNLKEKDMAYVKLLGIINIRWKMSFFTNSNPQANFWRTFGTPLRKS